MTRTTLIALTALLALPGCAKNKKAIVLVPEAEPVPVIIAEVDIEPIDASDTSPAAIGARQMRENFARVHFEFDESELNAESRESLAANVEIMKEFPRLLIEVQGHADERGTTEYNLALGQRRADAVKGFMIAQGIDGSRIRTVTYGEERPVSDTDTPNAWSRDRRAEFRVLLGPRRVAGTVGR